MNDFNLVCLDFQECNLLPQVTSSLTEILSIKVVLGKAKSDIENYFHPERGQYNASSILSEYNDTANNDRTILITSVDLYIPIFTFIFGLAKLNGGTGIVSVHRLRTGFYGLPPDEDLLKARLIKEIVHEFGHLLNLRHCINYQCVMASSNTADDLDIKGDRYCESCLTKVDAVQKT